MLIEEAYVSGNINNLALPVLYRRYIKYTYNALAKSETTCITDNARPVVLNLLDFKSRLKTNFDVTVLLSRSQFLFNFCPINVF